jgi:hypothetical protein
MKEREAELAKEKFDMEAEAQRLKAKFDSQKLERESYYEQRSLRSVRTTTTGLSSLRGR